MSSAPGGPCGPGSGPFPPSSRLAGGLSPLTLPSLWFSPLCSSLPSEDPHLGNLGESPRLEAGYSQPHVFTGSGNPALDLFGDLVLPTTRAFPRETAPTSRAWHSQRSEGARRAESSRPAGAWRSSFTKAQSGPHVPRMTPGPWSSRL